MSISSFRKLDLPSFEGIYEEFIDVSNQHNIDLKKNGQVCINTTKDALDDYMMGTGSLMRDWSKNVVEDGKIIVPLRDVPLKPQDFTELCSQFKGTMIEEMFNVLKENFNVGRVRFMRSEPKTCLTWHYDLTPRIHYPVKTQDGCFMVIEDEVKHLSINTWWYTETKKMHTAFNSSKEYRVHIVAEVL